MSLEPELRGTLAPSRAPHWWQFVASSLSDVATSAAVAPSSRRLATAMLRHVDFSRARTLVELGPGSGAITALILERMRPDATLYAVEISSRLTGVLAARLPDHRLVPITGDAARLARLLPGIEGQADAVISSVGFGMIPEPAVRAGIVAAAADALSAEGTLVQFGYLHCKWICIHPGARPMVSRFDYADFLAGHFDVRGTEVVLANLPPARVFTCGKRRPVTPSRTARAS